MIEQTEKLLIPVTRKAQKEAPHPNAGNLKPIITQISLSGARI
jgi:hypothetical protein